MPRLNNKSKQYLFKNKLNFGQKPKSQLIKESFIMLATSIFLIILNCYIPRKIQLLSSFNTNLIGIFSNLLEIAVYMGQILVVLFLIFSCMCSLILIIGGLNRILKVLLRNTRKIPYR